MRPLYKGLPIAMAPVATQLLLGLLATQATSAPGAWLQVKLSWCMLLAMEFARRVCRDYGW